MRQCFGLYLNYIYIIGEIIFISCFSLFIPNSKAWLMSSSEKQEELLKYKRNLFDPVRLNFIENVTLPKY